MPSLVTGKGRNVGKSAVGSSAHVPCLLAAGCAFLPAAPQWAIWWAGQDLPTLLAKQRGDGLGKAPWNLAAVDLIFHFHNFIPLSLENSWAFKSLLLLYKSPGSLIS